MTFGRLSIGQAFKMPWNMKYRGRVWIKISATQAQERGGTEVITVNARETAQVV